MLRVVCSRVEGNEAQLAFAPLEGARRRDFLRQCRRVSLRARRRTMGLTPLCVISQNNKAQTGLTAPTCSGVRQRVACTRCRAGTWMETRPT